jgi:hypothetical protein
MSELHVARWRGARSMAVWLCTQERLHPEVAIIFGTAARYRRAKIESTRDDARPDNSTIRMGVVVSTPALWRAPSS